ncbi:MAG TPA: tetratricopeptide repeat protein [Blastocatellia bacterium]|nr:tetratricopeptide repeat protein [Blastocatellia bacterium]
MNPKPEIAEKVLSLLRKWGWEKGLDRLKAEIRSTKDQNRRAPMHIYVAWMSGERGASEEAAVQFGSIQQYPALAGWALISQAFIAIRKGEYAQSRELINKAMAQGDTTDTVLRATIHHCYGSALYREGQPEAALPHLHESLRLFGKDHFQTGRVLDTLGLLYASKGNLFAAREFFEKSVEIKARFEDEAGLAISHCKQGRLYLDWGYIEKAEQEFQLALDISERIADARARAQLLDYLGQVALMSGRVEDAASWLDHSIETSHRAHLGVAEAFARKDRALVHISEGEIKEAEGQAQQAEDLFQIAGFDEGVAHVNRVWGIIRQRQARYDEAKRALLAALNYFDSHKEKAEAARTQLEVARLLKVSNAPRPMVTSALIAALNRAEQSRRDSLVREAERELKAIDPAAHCRHVYQRARGRDVKEDISLLSEGAREVASIMSLNLEDSAWYIQDQEPGLALVALNQIMADFEESLDRHGAPVVEYQADGLVALFRGTDHGGRAVSAALGLMEMLDELNRPRIVLGLKPLSARIGVSTGEVMTGNVGTYRKMDFNVLGSAVDLAFRLREESEPGLPCISRETHDLLPEGAFVFKTGSPRTLTLKTHGRQQVWDVLMRRDQKPE